MIICTYSILKVKIIKEEFRIEVLMFVLFVEVDQLCGYIIEIGNSWEMDWNGEEYGLVVRRMHLS